MTLRVSVVIPVYNAASDLEQCLASLGGSTVVPVECIVVDDGSTDDSLKIAAQHGAKVRSTGGRFGPAPARNIGARAASGEIVLFLDADVCVSPDTISKIVTEFTQDPELDAVMGSYQSQAETVRRLAVEAWLQRNGVITITQNKKVLPVFLEQFAHN
jgi:glycosyltransferase involved in cell wall biosynthesis